MMSGKCFSASISQVVTCARMSRTDHVPVTPGCMSCGSDKPAYDSSISAQALSSRFRSCCRSKDPSLRIVEDDAERSSVPRSQTAHAVPHVDLIKAALPLHGPMMHGEDH